MLLIYLWNTEVPCEADIIQVEEPVLGFEANGVNFYSLFCLTFEAAETEGSHFPSSSSLLLL